MSDNIVNEKLKTLTEKGEKLVEKISKLTHEYNMLYSEYQEKYLRDDLELEEHLRQKTNVRRKAIKKNENDIINCKLSLLYVFTFFMLILAVKNMLVEYAFLKIISTISFIASASAAGIININTIKKIISDYKIFKTEYDDKLEGLQQKVNSDERKKDEEKLEEKQNEIKKAKTEYEEVEELERLALREISKHAKRKNKKFYDEDIKYMDEEPIKYYDNDTKYIDSRYAGKKRIRRK